MRPGDLGPSVCFEVIIIIITIKTFLFKQTSLNYFSTALLLLCFKRSTENRNRNNNNIHPPHHMVLVCDFCSLPSQQELAQCRCFHFFCDTCSSVVGCADSSSSSNTTNNNNNNNNCDANFSACSFCPKCSVECEINNYKAAVDLAKMLDDDERARSMPPPPPPKAKPPVEYLCPITRDIMNDPVVLNDGFSYERVAIVEWFRSSRVLLSPMTGASVANALMPNTVLRVMINEWKQQNNYVADVVNIIISSSGGGAVLDGGVAVVVGVGGSVQEDDEEEDDDDEE